MGRLLRHQWREYLATLRTWLCQPTSWETTDLQSSTPRLVFSCQEPLSSWSPGTTTERILQQSHRPHQPHALQGLRWIFEETIGLELDDESTTFLAFLIILYHQDLIWN